MKRKVQPSSVLTFLLFLLLCIIILFPLLCLLLGAFKPSSYIIRFGLNAKIEPEIMSLDNFRTLFSGGNDYFTWYRNSIIVTVVQTVASLFLSAAVAYGFTMYQFRGKKLLFGCVLVVMMIPIEIIMLPLYRELIAFHMLDSFAGVILPFMAAPIPIFFFRQYLRGMPMALLDAGRIDGCNEYRIFGRIYLPLMAPAFASMGIYQGMVSWNNFLWPLIVLRSADKLTLPIGLATLLTPYGDNYGILLSGSVFAIIPILILFLLFQKYFIAGMTAGGVKE